MWHVINEEREACGNIASYCNITHIKKRSVYNVINEVMHDTTHMLLPTMKVVT